MNSLEAIKSIDGYSEALVSLSALLGAKMFEEKSNEHERLLAQIRETQNDGRWIVLETMKAINDVGIKSDPSGDVSGISAAVARYVAGDNQASEALKKKEGPTVRNEVAEALRKFRESTGLTG
jgi:hypothetical protein